MKKPLFVFLALVMGMASFAGSAFAQPAVNVTTATDCAVTPGETNQVVRGQPINAAVQVPSGDSVNDLTWALITHGNLVANGSFTDVCTDPTTGVELVSTGQDSTFLPVAGNNGESYTLAVEDGSGKNLGKDHFQLLP